VRPTPDATVSAPITWQELASCEPRDFTLKTMQERFAKIGDRHEGIDGTAGSLAALLELSARQERDGLGDAPWPPYYEKKIPSKDPKPKNRKPSKARRGG
jgi:hypothetical protein